MYKIYCETYDQFVDLTIKYMQQGVGFTSNVNNLIIELTGAYWTMSNDTYTSTTHTPQDLELIIEVLTEGL